MKKQEIRNVSLECAWTGTGENGTEKICFRLSSQEKAVFPASPPIRLLPKILFCPLVALLLAFEVTALAEPSDAEPDKAPRIGLLSVEQQDLSARQAAFFKHLGEVYELEQPPAPVSDANFVCTLEELRSKAALLMERQDLDLVLAADPMSLRALAAEHNKHTPVLAFSPYCVASALDGGPDNKTDDAPESRPDLFFLFPEDFLCQRLSLLRQLTGFKKLGFIAPAKDADEKARLEALALESAAALIAGKTLELYVFEDLARADEENCREALDSLFFDQTDALLLDGSGCFAPDAPHFTELLHLAQSRGMLPLSLTDPDLYRHGALLSPWSGNDDRLGRFLAACALGIMDAALEGADSGTEFALNNDNADAANKDDQPAEPTRSPRLLPLPGWQPYFSLNLAVAADMAFEPSAGLLALTRSYLGLPASGEPEPETSPAAKEYQP
ncbi:hypothetical protein LJC09_01105 [Desulfovibrio sp. OttesenSCG-928-F20]|nr:hypothetical protein [Desulfovibrio sp. OttesenSCG-928-F20]